MITRVILEGLNKIWLLNYPCASHRSWYFLATGMSDHGEETPVVFHSQSIQVPNTGPPRVLIPQSSPRLHKQNRPYHIWVEGYQNARFPRWFRPWRNKPSLEEMTKRITHTVPIFGIDAFYIYGGEQIRELLEFLKNRRSNTVLDQVAKRVQGNNCQTRHPAMVKARIQDFEMGGEFL